MITDLWSPSPRARWWMFLLAFSIRLWSVADSSVSDPAFLYPIIDEQTNVDQARGFLEHGPPHETPYWKPPGYPALLALLALPWSDIGSSAQAVPASFAWTVKIFQCLLDSISALLILQITALTAGRKSALLASGLYAIASMPVFFCGQLLDTTVFTFLILLSVSLARNALATGHWSDWIQVGMAIGLASITRATGLPVALGLAVLALLQPRRWSVCLVHSGALLGACALTLLPIATLNWKSGDDLVLISSNGGINFYIGNRSGDGIGEDGLTSVAAGPRWNRLLEKSSHLSKPSQRSRHYYQLALAEMVADPLQWAGQMVRKGAALISARDVPNNKNLVEETRRNLPLRILAWLPGASGPLVALILVGLLIRRRGLPEEEWPVRVALLMLLLTTCAFFIAGRYRVPLMALGCIVAGRGLATLGLRWRSLFLYLGMWLLVVAIPVPSRALVEDYCIDPVAIGYVHEQRDEPEEATRWYRRSLEQDPDDVRALHNLGHLAQQAGDVPRALELFRQATTTRPDHSPSWNSLGALLAPIDPLQARICFERAVEEEPRYRGAWINLGQLLESHGDLHKALDAFQRARRIDPDRSLAPILEARVQQKLRKPRNAMRLLQMVDPERLQPGSAELYQQLLQQVDQQLQLLQTKPQQVDPAPVDESPEDESPRDRPEERGVVG
ncbi:MAG: tetratricopeptide repeat protein [Planctomycetota bacterium]|nr:tetratricopeptide repeat protein [Planctomycetota bacterium]